METIEYVNPKIDRSLWPVGEWHSEPDKKQWKDAATGLPCLANRHPQSGHWCGYVGVPKTHPYYGKGYEVPDVEVHWGLTFSDKCQAQENECEGICHKAPKDEDDVWWLGFDCAHSGDYSPMDAHRSEAEGGIWTLCSGGSYKNLQFVERECADLAAQLSNTNPINT